ncbi:HAD family hydrolase [Ilumatobacter sp.]|uniref:HAD family hydrolase n=1 Tax=Ilumatobacter sp. TaxID=1967498 RepID=UPI003C315672
MKTDEKAQPPIAAVFFDFGGVICNDPFRVMAAVASSSGFEMAEFASIAVGYGDYGDGDHPWHRLERGEIEVAAYEQAVVTMARERGHDGFPPLPVDLILSQVLVVRPEMMELLGDLRAQGVATAILTNNVRALGAWRDTADWDQLVDAVIDSCEVGMRKPEHRMFNHACELLGVSPAQAAFLDDMQANVDAAAEVGLSTVLVADPTDAIATLRELIER